MSWNDDGWAELVSPSGLRLDMDPDRHVPLDFTPPEPKAPVVHNVRLVSEWEGYPERLTAWWAECLTCGGPVGYLYAVRLGGARAKAEADAQRHQAAAA